MTFRGTIRLGDAGDKRVRFYRNDGTRRHQLRLKLYGMDAIALSDAVPAFENFGFKAIEEVTTPLGQGGRLGHIHRFLLARHDGGDAAALMERAPLLQQTLAQVVACEAEDDGFNALIVSAGLEPQSVVLVRALFRYLKQAGMPYALSTVVEALRQQQHITRALIDLFHACHDPAFEGDRTEAGKTADEVIVASLAQVTSIDEDRIIRLFQAVIHACLRTNFFLEAARWRWPSSSIAQRCRAFPSHCRGAKSGSIPSGWKVSTCAPAWLRVAACAGQTGATTSAPRFWA